jgi:hypothetical protein
LAQIWVSGGTHITQGVVKLNDSYFNTAKYDNPNERLHVVCQEVGHTFGLAHQSESGVSLNTCMDYSTSPTSTKPNAHDYEELGIIYAHLDSTNTSSKLLPAPATGDLNSPGEWGKLVSQSANGKTATFERDLGHGQKVLTHVYYAD